MTYHFIVNLPIWYGSLSPKHPVLLVSNAKKIEAGWQQRRFNQKARNSASLSSETLTLSRVTPRTSALLINVDVTFDKCNLLLSCEKAIDKVSPLGSLPLRWVTLLPVLTRTKKLLFRGRRGSRFVVTKKKTAAMFLPQTNPLLCAM